jgi:DNA-binding CsgD family transcriptional regulator
VYRAMHGEPLVLTTAERKAAIDRLIAGGLSNNEVGRRLNVAYETVSRRRTDLRRYQMRERLTAAQLSALALTAEGLSRGQVGERMSVSRDMVEKLLKQARAKLGALNTTHAAVIACRTGLFDQVEEPAA